MGKINVYENICKIKLGNQKSDCIKLEDGLTYIPLKELISKFEISIEKSGATHLRIQVNVDSHDSSFVEIELELAKERIETDSEYIARNSIEKVKEDDVRKKNLEEYFRLKEKLGL